MERIRNDEWKEDGHLSEEMERLINEGFKRKEILSFVQRDFSQYAWSKRTLDRRITFFNLSKQENYSNPQRAQEAIEQEVKGPGKLIGIRTMQQKLYQVHNIKLPRDVVHGIMGVVDPEGLERRKPRFKAKQKGQFLSPGPNYVHSLDGHDKLMGFQNSTFPLAIYGCIDTCSRQILWIKVFTTNSDPKFPALWYYQYLRRTKIIARYLRVDKGTETVDLTAIHAVLLQKILNVDDAEAADSIIYGPSTSNQIERWWRELHERLEMFYKDILYRLKLEQHYDPYNENDRNLLVFIMIPILEKEIDCFVKLWNTHRIRKQKGVVLPDGIPEHIYNFPEEYGLQNHGLYVSDDLLDIVRSEAPMASEHASYVDETFSQTCRNLYPREISNNSIYEDFVALKELLKNHTSYYS